MWMRASGSGVDLHPVHRQPGGLSRPAIEAGLRRGSCERDIETRHGRATGTSPLTHDSITRMAPTGARGKGQRAARPAAAFVRGRDLVDVTHEWGAELGDIPTAPLLIAFTLQRLSVYIEREFTAIARARGIGPGDMRILFALARVPSHRLASKDLLKELLITSGAVSKQVDRLEARGLVTRIADPDVLRGVLIRLEPAGRELADEVAREILTSFCGLETLKPQQAERAQRVLDELRLVMESALFGE
jgi:DNA-binding MarR family transcriptional regulator